MNDRQEKFCIEFVRCGNATEAYKRAGYQVKTEEAAGVNASRLLRNANVQQYIAKLREKADDAKILNAKERRMILSEIVNDLEASKRDRIRAIDVMNKMDGIYITKTELTGADGGAVQIAWESGKDG